MKLGDIYIMGAVRTAIGKYGGSLKNVPAHELASLVIRESLNRSGVPDDLVDEVILGEVRQTTESSNIARAALLEAGLPESVPGFTVNRLCASAMQAVYSGSQEIKCGIADVIVAGGTENLSRAPVFLRGSRWGGNKPQLVDSNSLVISGSDIWIIVALVVVAMPLIAAIAGVVVWLRRRRL